MSILKIVSNEPRTLVGIIKYAARETNKEKILFEDAIGLNPRYATEEIMLIKQLLHSEGGRQYRQIILSFDQDVNLPVEKFREIAYKIGLYYGKNFSIFIAGHKDTKNFHVHYILNPVNIYTGYKFISAPYSLIDCKNYANTILIQYGLSPIDIYSSENDLCEKNLLNPQSK